MRGVLDVNGRDEARGVERGADLGFLAAASVAVAKGTARSAKLYNAAGVLVGAVVSMHGAPLTIWCPEGIEGALTALL